MGTAEYVCHKRSHAERKQQSASASKSMYGRQRHGCIMCAACARMLVLMWLAFLVYKIYAAGCACRRL